MPYSPRIVSFNKGCIAKHDRCFRSADASQYPTLIGSCPLFRQQTHVLTAYLDREPRTVIHVKRAKIFDPMG